LRNAKLLIVSKAFLQMTKLGIFIGFFTFHPLTALDGNVLAFIPKINVATTVRPLLTSQVRPQPQSHKIIPFRPAPKQNSSPIAIRYSQSAQAANMIMPALWLGLPTLFIIALIIRSMRGD